MRRQLSPRGHRLPARLFRRAERATYGINPYLLALALGLAGLNMTCYVAIRTLLRDRQGLHSLQRDHSTIPSRVEQVEHAETAKI